MTGQHRPILIDATDWNPDKFAGRTTLIRKNPMLDFLLQSLEYESWYLETEGSKWPAPALKRAFDRLQLHRHVLSEFFKVWEMGDHRDPRTQGMFNALAFTVNSIVVEYAERPGFRREWLPPA
ncbi:hypothetical protein FPZ12_023980 [Amycolatopsis acidicola]|uniref:Uncharacterized protein n=1 Tax=Amycolatopsis acidicola TaxID=2596893 RepID=A0A5N0UX47_9PSEU|nr:hypothetical protein [Amycolatopsis acidicola]KAA9157946.1 hypothetical protein FPZ12_023980 [Amycolatopsis acidicola]